MSVMKYKDPKTGDIKKVGAPKYDVYSKDETNTLLLKKADLDENGKVLTTQLPDMNYAPLIHVHDASDITTGVLPVANGGTGVTSLSDLASQMGGAKIQTGSYVGTGTYGASNPCSLTFDFEPTLVWIYLRDDSNRKSYSTNDGFSIVNFESLPTSYTQSFGFCSKLITNQFFGARSEKTVMWYSLTSSVEQYNYANDQYFWIAL